MPTPTPSYSDDPLFTDISTLRTAGSNYAKAYTIYKTCIQTNTNQGNNDTLAETNCASSAPSSTEFDAALTKLRTTAYASKSTTTADYIAMRDDIIATDKLNENTYRILQNIVDGNEYKEVKRETDAVIYAWTLWVMVFIITAVVIFMYM